VQSLGFTSNNKETGVLVLVATMVWMIVTVRVIVPGGLRLPAFSFGHKAFATQPPRVETTHPKVSFADVGGCDDAKKQITEIVQNRLNPGRLKQYGVVRNGILLHGPRGSGKTFLAEATAGEFSLNYFYVSPSQLTSMWVGGTENNLRGVFSQALANKPVLVFIDEIDTLGAARVTFGKPETWGVKPRIQRRCRTVAAVDRPAPGCLRFRLDGRYQSR
jgi:ATP-dependent Zn protease